MVDEGAEVDSSYVQEWKDEQKSLAEVENRERKNATSDLSIELQMNVTSRSRSTGGSEERTWSSDEVSLADVLAMSSAKMKHQNQTRKPSTSAFMNEVLMLRDATGSSDLPVGDDPDANRVCTQSIHC